MTEEEGNDETKGFFDGTLQADLSDLTEIQKEFFKKDFLKRAVVIQRLSIEVPLHWQATTEEEPVEVPPHMLPLPVEGMERVEPCVFHDSDDLEMILHYLEGDGSTFLELAETIEQGDEGEAADALSRAYREFGSFNDMCGWHLLIQMEYKRDEIEWSRPDAWNIGNIKERVDEIPYDAVYIDLEDFLRDWLSQWASAYMYITDLVDLTNGCVVNENSRIESGGDILLTNEGDLAEEVFNLDKRLKTTEDRLLSAIHMGLLCRSDYHFWLDETFLNRCSSMVSSVNDLAKKYYLSSVIKPEVATTSTTTTSTTTTSTTTTPEPSVAMYSFRDFLRGYLDKNSPQKSKWDLSLSTKLLDVWRGVEGLKDVSSIPIEPDLKKYNLALAAVGAASSAELAGIGATPSSADPPPTASPDAQKVAEKIAKIVVANDNGDGTYCTQLDVRHFLGYNLKQRDPDDGSKKVYSAAWKYDWVLKPKTEEGKAAGKLILENWEKLFAPDGKPNKNSKAVTIDAAAYLLEHLPSRTRQYAKLDI